MPAAPVRITCQAEKHRLIRKNDDLATIPKVSTAASDFSENVVRANIELVQGYKKLQNEF